MPCRDGEIVNLLLVDRLSQTSRREVALLRKLDRLEIERIAELDRRKLQRREPASTMSAPFSIQRTTND